MFEEEGEPEQGGPFGEGSGSIYLGSGLGGLQAWFDRNPGRFDLLNPRNLLNRVLVEEARAGNYGRALRNVMILGTLYPLAGEGVIALKNLLLGRERKETEPWERYLNDLAAAGTLGIVADAFQSTRSAESVGRFLAGPTVSDAMDLGRALGSKKPAERLKKFAERRTPLIEASKSIAGRMLE